MTIQGQPVATERAIAAMEAMKARNKRMVELLKNEDVRALVTRAEQKAAQDNSSYMLYSLLLAIETASEGNKLAAGQVFDDAITHFLAEYEAALGKEAVVIAARSMIHNIALFLPDKLRDQVHAVVGKRGH